MKIRAKTTKYGNKLCFHALHPFSIRSIDPSSFKLIPLILFDTQKNFKKILTKGNNCKIMKVRVTVLLLLLQVFLTESVCFKLIHLYFQRYAPDKNITDRQESGQNVSYNLRFCLLRSIQILTTM